MENRMFAMLMDGLLSKVIPNIGKTVRKYSGKRFLVIFVLKNCLKKLHFTAVKSSLGEMPVRHNIEPTKGSFPNGVARVLPTRETSDQRQNNLDQRQSEPHFVA